MSLTKKILHAPTKKRPKQKTVKTKTHQVGPLLLYPRHSESSVYITAKLANGETCSDDCMLLSTHGSLLALSCMVGVTYSFPSSLVVLTFDGHGIAL